MNNIAVYFGKPTFLINDYYVRHLFFLKGADFISNSNIDKYDGYGIFNNTIKNEALDLYKMKYNDYEKWSDFYDELDVSYLKKYKMLVCFFPQIIEQWADDKKQNFNFNDLNYKSFLKYQSYGSELASIISLVKASEQYKIPLIQMNFELGCANFNDLGLKPYNYNIFHGYNYNNIKCLTSLPYFYSHYNDDFFIDECCDKKFDFVYYGTYIKGQCQYKINDLKNFEQKYLKNFNVVDYKFCDSTKNDKIPFTNYILKLKNSKYTYISPSYIKNVFAIDRFVDGIFNDCLPLIGDGVFVDDVSNTFDYDFEQIRINNFSINENNRLKTIEEIKNKLIKYESPTQTLGKIYE